MSDEQQERARLIELTGRSSRYWASCWLRRSPKAKRVSARMLPGGEVELVLPLRHPEKQALDFLQGQGEWLEKQIAKSVPPIALTDHLRKNPHLSMDGKKRACSMEFKSGKSSPSWLCSEKGSLTLLLDPAANPEKQAILLAREVAKVNLPVRTALLGDRFGLHPNRVRVGDQRSRWGSCSSKGVLSFNWRLLLLQPKLQDYVICHELAHLKIMDHSENYWNFLATLNPKAAELDRQLTKLSGRLMNVGRLAKTVK